MNYGKQFGRLLVGLLVFACALATGSAKPLSGQNGATSFSCHYTFELQRASVENKFMRIELYRPTENGNHPLIVVLSGSQGVYSRRSAKLPQKDNLGEKTLARHCFTVALPHYFDALGRTSAMNRPFLERNFPNLLKMLAKIVEIEGDLPETRNSGIGIYAQSYGAYLAFGLAFENQRIHAISEFSGGWPGSLKPGFIKNLAVLIYHGRNDTIVPFSEATGLTSRLRSSGAHVFVRECLDQGHYLSANSRKEDLDESITFFSHYLMPALDRHPNNIAHGCVWFDELSRVPTP